MIRRFLELVRFSHTLFALPPALLSALMAWHVGAGGASPAAFRWQDLAGILVCMVGARSAAMSFNRLVDRRFDALNPRTEGRHLPRGTVSVAAVAGMVIVSSAVFFAGTLLFLPRNPIPLVAAAPVLAVLLGYSFAKRFTALSHFWLGAALGLAPPAAWVAIRAEVAWPPLLLGAAIMFWVAGFDIIYACQDVDFDRRAGLASVPARWGIAAALRLAALCHLAAVLLLMALPAVYDGFGPIYLGGVAAIALLLAYEHRLVRPDDLAQLNRAFFHVNAVVSIGLLLIGGADLIW